MADSVPVSDLPQGAVRRAGPWTVAHGPGGPRAVSSRCRHQLADLSQGTVAADGCLVCPWHGARYDLDSGQMVRGPRGFFGYRGKTPGYTELVALLGKVLPLRRRPVRQVGDRYEVQE